jgi:outer membrane protein assembly factor BamB
LHCRTYFLSISICLAGLVSGASAQETYWNQFRGPTGDGISQAKNLPVEFDETTNVRWKTAIHDQGWSSPVVWGDQIWLTTAREDGTELFALCVNVDTGEIVHDIKVFDEPDPQLQWGGHNTHATPTPILEEGRAYINFGSYGTACLDTATGEKLWENRELKCDHRVRPASSPIINGDSLFLTFDGVDVQFVAALDKNSGEVLWIKDRTGQKDMRESLKNQGFSDPEIDRVEKMKPDDNRKSYATPTIIEVEGAKQLISPGAEITFSYDPQSGEENWRVKHEGFGYNVASRPVYDGGLLFLTQGISSRMVAVDPSGEGDVTESHVVWSADNRVPEIPSLLVADGLLFMVSDRGSLSCLDAATGEQLWRERLRGGGTYWGSPIYADGRIYIANTKGNVYVVAAKREFDLLAMNEFNVGEAENNSDALPAEITAEYVKELMKGMGVPEDQLDKSHEGMLKQGMTNAEAVELLKSKGAKGPTGGPDGGVGFIASPAVAGDAIILRSETHLYSIAQGS